MRKNNIEVIAHHEAGHIVIGHIVGLGMPDSVSIRPIEGALGHVAGYRNPCASVLLVAAEAEVMMCVAGVIAANAYKPRSHHWLAQGSSDYSRADSLLAMHYSDDDASQGKALRRLEREVRALVKRPEVSSAIEYVADQLMKRETIEGDDFVDLLNAVGTMVKDSFREYLRK